MSVVLQTVAPPPDDEGDPEAAGVGTILVHEVTTEPDPVRASPAEGTVERANLVSERHPMIPVAPDLVAEIAVDTAFEDGRWRHPVRLLRLREDVDPADVPPFGQGNRPAAG